MGSFRRAWEQVNQRRWTWDVGRKASGDDRTNDVARQAIEDDRTNDVGRKASGDDRTNNQ